MEHVSTPTATPHRRNLVICCDGTGNKISENISNALKLHRCLRKPDNTQPRQMAPYVSGSRHRSATRKHPPRALTVH
ncbi:DUF2235 domain-containing protein [Bradyrhizobium sp. BRP19]|uniref:phospholipase effector Tle1 domain-containing protein n=1 Tax=Bradyrhizobium sp. BRP19 TaxID=2793823 RepID=UPI0032090783